MCKKLMKSLDDSVDESELHCTFPQLVFAMRDFTFEFEDADSEDSADRYLENCLELQSGSDMKNEEYNRPKKAILKYFASRKCFSFDRPVDRRQKLQNLDILQDIELSTEFVEELSAFLQYMNNHCPVKKNVRGIDMTGNGKLLYICHYTQCNMLTARCF